MTHTLPIINWHTVLAEIINKANDGDTIICQTDNKKELAERAASRMCPDKKLSFCMINYGDV